VSSSAIAGHLGLPLLLLQEFWFLQAAAGIGARIQLQMAAVLRVPVSTDPCSLSKLGAGFL